MLWNSVPFWQQSNGGCECRQTCIPKACTFQIHLWFWWQYLRVDRLPERAPPLPTLFATAVVGAALRRQDLRLCVLILIAFHALLRTGEMCRVQASHFVRPEKAGPIFLTLSNTKSGNVVLTDPVLIQYLHVLLPRILPGEHLWPKDSRSFRTQFRELCADAGLPPLPWRPYSLRRGGATAHFLQFGSLDKTAVRGRWQSTRTARLHVDEGVAALASIVSTPAQERHIRSLAASVATAQLPFR